MIKFTSRDIVNKQEIEIDYDVVRVTKKGNLGLSKKYSNEIRINEIRNINLKSSGLFSCDIEINSLYQKIFATNFTKKEGEKIRKLIHEYKSTSRVIRSRDYKLDSIKIGNQIWASNNSTIDLNQKSLPPENNEKNIKNYGRLYSSEGAIELQEIYPGWKIPSVRDYEILFSNLNTKNLAKTLKKDMNFTFSGFNSPFYPEYYVKPDIYGKYWTSNARKDNNGNILISILSIEKITNYISFEEINTNDMYSVRLIYNQ